MADFRKCLVAFLIVFCVAAIAQPPRPTHQPINALNDTGAQLQYVGRNIVVTQLATPSAPGVTIVGTSGSTTWAYAVVAINLDGSHSPVSSSTSNASGNATLSNTNYNIVSTTAVANAASCLIYRTTAGGTPNTTGIVGSVQCGYSLVDNGLTGDASSAPSDNSTGWLAVQNRIINYRPVTALTNTTTVTAAVALDGIINGTPTGAATYTTDTATNILAQLPSACVVGMTARMLIRNTSGGANTITVAGGTGVTTAGTMTVAQNNFREFLFNVTNCATPAVTLYGIASGAF